MKRILSALLCLAVLLVAAAAPAEEPEGNGFQWGAYELKATWVTTDNAKIHLVNMREDGLFVMVRLAGVGTPVYADDVKAIQEGEFVLVDAAGKEYGISTWIMRKLIQPEGGGFPTMAEEQEFFDILFFLEGKTEGAEAGARLRVGDEMIDLDGIPRELPAEE